MFVATFEREKDDDLWRGWQT
jgi:hypothetical protein